MYYVCVFCSIWFKVSSCWYIDVDAYCIIVVHAKKLADTCVHNLDTVIGCVFNCVVRLCNSFYIEMMTNILVRGCTCTSTNTSPAH